LNQKDPFFQVAAWSDESIEMIGKIRNKFLGLDVTSAPSTTNLTDVEG